MLQDIKTNRKLTYNTSPSTVTPAAKPTQTKP